MKFFNVVLFVLLPLMITGCDSSGSDTETGTLRVLMTDAPAEYESVNIDVEVVRVHRSTAAEPDEEGWIDIMNEPQELDLLSLVNGNVALLGELDLEPGVYHQMRLVLGDENELVIDGETISLDTPSAQQSGLKLNIDSEITEGGLFSLLLDFDASRSIVQAGNPGKYILKPVIRTVSLEATGSISGDIIPVEAQPWVYAIAGTDTLAGTRANEAGDFLLIGLPSGTYQVSVEPSTDQYEHEVTSNVDVVPDATTELDPIDITKNN